MLGQIKRKIERDYDNYFGYIVGDDNNDYFFHETMLQNCKWEEIEEGDVVIFTPYVLEGNYRAKGIKKKIEKPPIKCTVYPGLQYKLRTSHFNEEEINILDTLGKTFYVTNGGEVIKLGATSEYRYCLIKPTDFFKEQFNLDREIIVIFSRYEHFEPRTFDAISAVYRNSSQQFRLDKICSVVISKDTNAINEIRRMLKSDTEMQVIIPFSYHELITGDQSNLITNRFREYFFERDLFAFESPLKKDIYFFGRREYVHELINRHKSGENSGVFGLRRSGKTSVLEAVKRTAKLNETTCVFIDCQELYHYRWNRALHFVMAKIAETVSSATEIVKDNYSEENASASFSNDLKSMLEKINDIILLFDEVEQITPNLSLSNYWKKENDFTIFWHAIRKNVHEWSERFTFILAGTNPTAVEITSINKVDNPLFNQLKADSYLPPFSVENTKEMITKLGGYMGLTFDDIVCSNLTKDFGGHPYLIRHFCSAINVFLKEKGLNKPMKITNALYEKVMPNFVKKSADIYCKLILEVLVNYYPEENKFLERLALDNVSETEFKSTEPQLLSHLMGYNIIENNQGILGFKIEILKNYLIDKNKYKKLNLTTEEKWAEISERRNQLEKKLRPMIRVQLQSAYGESVAKQKVLNSMKPDIRSKYSTLAYGDLFDPNKCEIYFMNLGHLMYNEWDRCFKNLMSISKSLSFSYFYVINSLRADAHAKDITEDEMNSFRGAMSALEKELNKFFS